MRVGFVDYINALPLTHLFRSSPPSDLTITYAVPSALNAALRERQLDCSLVSTAEYLDGGHRCIPPYGIFAKGKIRSVNIHVRHAIKDLDGALVGLTEQSATSVSLLKILCHHFWKVKPCFELLDRSHLPSYEGILLIGDEALEKEHIPGFRTIDLATAWHEATGLPFVFAVFAGNASSEKVLSLMERSLAESAAHPEKIYALARTKSHLPLETIRDYYALCHYVLDGEALQGLETFKRLRADV